MTIKRPVPPPPPVEDDDLLRWMGLVNNNSVRIIDISTTLDPTLVSATTTVEQTFTVAGLGQNDLVISLIKPTLTAGIGIGNVRVQSEGVLAVTFINPTAGNIDPPSETYTLVVIRQ